MGAAKEFSEEVGRPKADMTPADVKEILQRVKATGGAIQEFNQRLISRNPGARGIEQATQYAADTVGEGVGEATEELVQAVEECIETQACLPPS